MTVALAPTGEWLVYQTQRPDLARNSIEKAVWLLSLQNRKTKKLPINEASVIDWEPGGRSFLYSDGKDLYSWNIAGHSRHRLVAGRELLRLFDGKALVNIQEIHVAPRGGLVALVLGLTGKVNEHPAAAVEVSPDWSLPPDTSLPGVTSPSATTRLVLVDGASGKIREVLNGHYELTTGYGHAVDWSPDGRTLVFSASTKLPTGDRSQFMYSDLYLWELSGGRIKTLVSETGPDFQPYWSPDGHIIAFITSAGKFDYEYKWQVGFVDMTSHTPRLTFPVPDPGADPGLSLIRTGGWSRDGKEFLFAASDHGYYKIHSVDMKGMREIDLRPGSDIGGWGSTELETARDSDVVAFGSGDFNHVPDLYAWKAFENGVQQLTNLNPIINDHPIANIENITWPSSDGKWRLQGFLLTPKHTRKEKPPLIVYVNGGPSMMDSLGVTAPLITGFPWPDFINRGYAIFFPNTRGRDGFGWAFKDALKDEHSRQRVPATDVISGVEYLINQGKVDPDRIGITAYSYGGGVAAYAIALSRIFKAASIQEAVALCPSDFYSSEPISINFAQEYGASSPIDPKLWDVSLRDYASVVVSSIKTPVLLRFGIKSEAQDQGRPFYNALQLAHVPSELVIDPRSGHFTDEPALVLDGYHRNLEWFDYWLGGTADARMEMRYGKVPSRN